MNFTIFGHRRSGNNFLKKGIDSNFISDKTVVSHAPFKDNLVLANGVFVVRDGRDVLTSCYYWWKGCRGSRTNFKSKTFSQYIRGENPVTSKQMELSAEFEKMFTDPIGFWIEYNECWFEKKLVVRFEDLKNNQVDVLDQIGKEFNLKMKTNILESVNKLVGYSPRKGIIGDWKTHFSKDDEELFWSKAKHVMCRLGYER